MIKCGRARPMPRTKKTIKISIVDPTSAKLMAVPRKGAVQGVARIVVRAPCKK